MKQGVLTALIVGFVVVAIGVGFLVGQGFRGNTAGAAGSSATIEELQASVDFLAQEVARLKSSGAGGGTKVAFVDMFGVLESLYQSADEEVRRALEEYQSEASKIRTEYEAVLAQFANGEITLNERDLKIQELQFLLEEVNANLSAPIQERILQVMREIGSERGYGLILDNPVSQKMPIVLFSQQGQADDITQLVIERLKANLEEE